MIKNAFDIKYFIELAHVLNVTRAAERLGISQPSLSEAIKRLEASLSVTLFTRHKNGVILTREGQLLLSQAKNLNQHWENLSLQLKNSKDEVGGRYKVGAHNSVALYTLNKTIPAFLQKYPYVEFDIIHDLSRKILDSIVTFEIDFGVVVNPLKHKDLIIKKLGDDKVTFWQSNIKDCDLETLIFDPNLLQSQSLLKKDKSTYKRQIKTSSLELTAELVENGVGIGIIPSRIAQKYNIKSLKGKSFITDEICFVYRYENKNQKTIQEFFKELIFL